ncbi:MAG: ABC transporter permease [Thermoprotei archaeon]|nr:ABC transporter permease [Thermoprotei archaeon]
MDNWRRTLRSIWAICWKDVKIYYAKGPIVVMGVLFPFFLWLAFQIGRGLEVKEGIAPLIAITAFFTSSAVTPIILPWETRQRTLEMLLARPITITRILIGDILASMLFGLSFSFLPVLYGLLLGIVPNNLGTLLGLLVLATLEFSTLGVLFSAMPTDVPADVVMISSAVKLPLIFVSGTFMPLNRLPEIMRCIALFSPLTYVTDLIRGLYGGGNYFPCILDISVTALYTGVFVLLTVKLHKITVIRRLQLK